MNKNEITKSNKEIERCWREKDEKRKKKRRKEKKRKTGSSFLDIMNPINLMLEA
jgi:hypothetical protein